MSKRLVIVSSTFISLWCCRCNDGGFSFDYHEHRPARTAEIHVAHVCTPECNHYYEGAKVIVVQGGHHHGPGCGHVLEGAHWVVVARLERAPTRAQPPHRVYLPSPPPTKTVVRQHRHGPNCGCVFDRSGSKWVVVGEEHVHGPGCGHVYVRGRWSVRR